MRERRYFFCAGIFLLHDIKNALPSAVLCCRILLVFALMPTAIRRQPPPIQWSHCFLVISVVDFYASKVLVTRLILFLFSLFSYFCKPKSMSGTVELERVCNCCLTQESCKKFLCRQNAVGHLPWQHYTVFKIPHSDTFSTTYILVIKRQKGLPTAVQCYQCFSLLSML